MGLAASQARFLNLTARKTNIEYEGQQINQQRTALANQSANYYSQMLTLSVPVPPSESNYSTIVYTYTVGGNTRTINQITGTDSNAHIVYTEASINNYDMASINNQNRQSIYNSIQGQSSKTLDEFSFQDSANILDGINTKLHLTDEDELDAEDVYCLVKGSGNNISYEYYVKADVDNTGLTAVNGFKQASTTVYTQDAEDGTITRDAQNRINSINGVAVTSATIKDSVAYNDAYAEYEYQTYLYQQKMEEINAQTSVIQAQDKKLELRLKQLDTEQNAIKTEMDSITNVIKDNTEKSFKVFG